MLKNCILKKDHYEVEHVIECKNCEIIHHDDEYIYIKPNEYTPFIELKKEIVTFLRKNPELYCDCKKIIYNNSSFEEVIKVKKNGIIIENDNQCQLTLLMYGIWFKTSYGPMIKCINYKAINTSTNFLQDPDEYNSDEEIKDSIENYKKFKKLQ